MKHILISSGLFAPFRGYFYRFLESQLKFINSYFCSFAHYSKAKSLKSLKWNKYPISSCNVPLPYIPGISTYY